MIGFLANDRPGDTNWREMANWSEEKTKGKEAPQCAFEAG
jgi:hypothetical protein